ncbi:MAG: class I SAM-dependent methyltransferase [Bacteroidia bacterium]|nr:class I SAM-dependent methyltransferase [Bacteroidia bacterium]MCZ2277573.1 class I SAM-dependent methyltransferase [Bacteroidia bacterium]
MHKRILDKLICPNSGTTDLKLYSVELTRQDKSVTNLQDENIFPDDDVKSGIIYSSDKKYVYVICEYIPVLLNDTDQDLNHLNSIVTLLKDDLPSELADALQNTSNRIAAQHTSADGDWNREEMKYYDAAVDTEKQRIDMLKSIKTDNLWRIFIPRKQKMIRFLEKNCNGKWIFEIGCGNARTISRIFNPAEYSYNYIGTDISFKRLIVAKMAIPGSDFIQASALNIPVKDNFFDAAISFGMLHHLPRPTEAMNEVDKKLKHEGIFTLHEPVYTSRQFTEKQTAVVRKLFRTYEHSDHDNKINLKETTDTLEKLNYQILNISPYNSLFRVVYEAFMNRVYKSWDRNERLTKAVLAIDNILLNTVVKLSNKLGPQAITITSAKKNQTK